MKSNIFSVGLIILKSMNKLSEDEIVGMNT